MIRCLMSPRFNMSAEVLTWEGNREESEGVSDIVWETDQDPITGEVIDKWVAKPRPSTNSGTAQTNIIKCLVRGSLDGGTRLSGSSETFGEEYKNIDYIKMWVPPNYKITKRDQITNIRNPQGILLWEEDDGDPVVFNVNGAVPILDPFNRLIETFVALERAE